MNHEYTPAPRVRLIKKRRTGVWLIPTVVVVLASCLVFALLQRNGVKLGTPGIEEALPYVSIVHPQVESIPQVLILPGNISAW
jgi:hypothetical protein